MSGVIITWSSRRLCQYETLLRALEELGGYLPEPLADRVDLAEYAQKLQQNADIAFATTGGAVVGIVAIYVNDLSAKNAYVPILAVNPSYRRMGIGRRMIEEAVKLAWEERFQTVRLQTENVNAAAISLYTTLGFKTIETTGAKITMERSLGRRREEISNCETPIQRYSALSDALNIDLRVKRDDLYPAFGGGNKARKASSIIATALSQNFDTIVTNGGLQSNHARATALACAENGLDCCLVLHSKDGVEPNMAPQGNLLLAHLFGAKIRYCTIETLSEAMDSTIEELKLRGRRPLYLWGGGHTLAGAMAMRDAAVATKLQCQDWEPQYVVHASGTGSTQAGLHVGYQDHPAQVIGISVARDCRRGSEVVFSSIKELESHLGSTKETSINEVEFLDNWTAGGYEQLDSRLLEKIRFAAKHGLLLDPTYTGKAWQGLCALVESGYIPANSRVLFWHTGGLLNLTSCEANVSRGLVR